MNILCDLQQSKIFSDIEVIDGVSNLHLQCKSNTKFDKPTRVNNTNLSNHQKSEQIPEIRDSASEGDRLKRSFCSKSVFNLIKNVTTET